MDYTSEEEFDNYISDRLYECEHRTVLSIPRKVVPAINPLDRYTEEEFREKYRFSKETTLSILLPLVYNDLQKLTGRGRPVPPISQLLVVLRFYATGSIQIVTRELNSLSQPSISRIVKRLSHLFSLKEKQFIKFPINIEETKEKFHCIGHFPNAVGAIGTTHIAILNPGGQNAKTYMNDEKYSSFNTQIVCGPDFRIYNIAHNPGSYSNNYIFESTVRKKFEREEIDGVLVGDTRYNCQKYLLTPVTQPQSKPEEDYNKALMLTQNIVNKTINEWKRLFPCLAQKLSTNVATTTHVIVATAILFNIFLRYDYKHSSEIVLCDNEIDTVTGDSVWSSDEGILIRNMFITEHFS